MPIADRTITWRSRSRTSSTGSGSDWTSTPERRATTARWEPSTVSLFFVINVEPLESYQTSFSFVESHFDLMACYTDVPFSWVDSCFI